MVLPEALWVWVCTLRILHCLQQWLVPALEPLPVGHMPGLGVLQGAFMSIN